MIAHAARRLLETLPVLWAAATLVWIFMFVIPGDPARTLAGQRADPEVLALVRAEWGLDRPALARYATFLGKLVRLDLGTSYVQRRPVTTIVAEAFTRTLFLAAAAALLAAGLGLAAGLAAAARPRGLLDTAALALSTAGVSLPSFWLGLMLILLFASRLGWFPVSGYGDGGSLLGVPLPGPLHLALPALTLAIVSSGLLGRVVRASLLEETGQEYARAARARGRSGVAVLVRHALPNALLPVVTVAGLNLGSLLGGAVATETIFNWPGLGRTLFQALAGRDLPVVEGCVLAMTAAFLLLNLVVDLSYALLDPRTRD